MDNNQSVENEQNIGGIRKVIIQSIIASIVPTIVSTIGFFIGSYISFNDAMIKIGDNIKLGDSNYLVSIDICNYKDKNLDNINIILPSDLKVENFKSNKSINVNKVTTSLNDEKSIWEVKRISGKENVTIIVNSIKPIDTSKINIKSDYKISVKSSDYQESKIGVIMQVAFIAGIVYFIEISLLNFCYLKRNEKDRKKMKEDFNCSIEEVNDKFKKVKKDCEEINKKYEEINKKYEERGRVLDAYYERSNNIENINRKNKIVLLARMKDYKKELDFWKDTIRKILYKENYSLKECDSIFTYVTENLKTYGTLEEKNIEYDDIIILKNLLGEKIE